MKIIKNVAFSSLIAIYLSACTPFTEALFIKAVVYATERISATLAAELLEQAFDKAMTYLFNMALDKTPDVVDVTPLPNNPLLGRKIGDHVYALEGQRDQADMQATISIPTQYILFERLSEGSKWELTNDSKNLIYERLDLASIQLSLQSLGYDPSRVDGVVGKKTKKAVRQFQEDNNIHPANGELNYITKELLLKTKHAI